MQIDDKDILRLSKQNAEEGFRLLLQKYQKPLYWHIRRLVVTHEDAEDASQECFIRAYRGLPTFRGESTLRTWLYQIATREALRLLQSQQRAESLDDVSELQLRRLASSPELDYSQVEHIELQKAILSLPSKQQLAFTLRYYDELGYDEIAQIMQSSIANVKANYHHAKNKIIEHMNQLTLL